MILTGFALRIGWRFFLFSTLLCAAFIASGASPSTANNETANNETANNETANNETLAGAWNTTIVFDDPSVAGCTTPGLNTNDGGIVAQGCDLSESPGYGQWRRIGPRKFAVTFVGLEFGPIGTGITGTYKVRATLTLSKDGQTSSGPFLTEVFALDGSLLFSGTGTVTQKRVGVEPLP